MARGGRVRGPGRPRDVRPSQHEPSLRAVRPIHERLPRDIGKSYFVGVPARVGEGKQGPPEQVAELGPGRRWSGTSSSSPMAWSPHRPDSSYWARLPAPGGGHGHPQLVHRESGKPVVAGDLGGQVRHVKSLELPPVEHAAPAKASSSGPARPPGGVRDGSARVPRSRSRARTPTGSLVAARHAAGSNPEILASASGEGRPASDTTVITVAASLEVRARSAPRKPARRAGRCLSPEGSALEATSCSVKKGLPSLRRNELVRQLGAVPGAKAATWASKLCRSRGRRWISSTSGDIRNRSSQARGASPRGLVGAERRDQREPLVAARNIR